MKFIITKLIEAQSIKDALTRESKAEIVDIQKEVEEPRMGF